jgi:CHAT domain-containing protein
VTTAPSVASWLRAAAGGTRPITGRVLLVAGPGLPDARSEVTELAASYPDTTVLTGADARVGPVLTAFDGASCAHVAAHGVFRADSPQFSALTLTDGPLTVFDLETVRRPPPLVVLSACDSGVTAAHSGDDLMGLAAALLAAGTKALIASVAPVPDASAKALMLDLHAGLRAGAAPAAALAAAQTAASDGTCAAAFVCIGAG